MQGIFRYVMRHKTSVTFDTDTLLELRELVRSGLFRNKSHAVEFSVKKLIKEVRNG